jgi:hypothetical protein
MDQTQDRRKRVDIMKEEITIEGMVIQEVIEELIDVAHLLTQLRNFMHLKIP